VRTACQFVVSNTDADLAFILENLAAQSLGVLEQIVHAARNLRRQSINQLRHLAAKLLNASGQDVAELGDQASNAIEGCGAFLDEAWRTRCRLRSACCCTDFTRTT
jgi:hypothetical protein